MLHPGGQSLIYVWALEQERNKVKSNYLQDSRVKKQRQNDSNKECESEHKCVVDDERCISLTGDHKDTLVKADQHARSHNVVDNKTCTEDNKGAGLPHDLDSGESQISSVKLPDMDAHHQQQPHAMEHTPYGAGDMAECGSSEKCELTVHINRTHFESQDLLVPWHLKSEQERARYKCDSEGLQDGGMSKRTSNDSSAVFHRFYHVFSEGELEDLCLQLPNVQVIKSYYDKGNWCVIIQKTH